MSLLRPGEGGGIAVRAGDLGGGHHERPAAPFGVEGGAQIGARSIASVKVVLGLAHRQQQFVLGLEVPVERPGRQARPSADAPDRQWSGWVLGQDTVRSLGAVGPGDGAVPGRPTDRRGKALAEAVVLGERICANPPVAVQADLAAMERCLTAGDELGWQATEEAFLENASNAGPAAEPDARDGIRGCG
jgi:hypothetical protein